MTPLFRVSSIYAEINIVVILHPTVQLFFYILYISYLPASDVFLVKLK